MAHIQMTEFHCHLSRSSLFWEVGGSEKIIQSKNILSIHPMFCGFILHLSQLGTC